jgi:hypothetical protein
MSLDIHDGPARLFDLAAQNVHQLFSIGAEFAHHQHHVVDGFGGLAENGREVD